MITVEINQGVGLGNRLRILFTYYKYARSIDSELTVIWSNHFACPGNFTDFFETMPHTTFVRKTNYYDKIDFTGKNLEPDEDFIDDPNLYDTLKLNHRTLNIIKRTLKTLDKKNYTAVHVRRTDHLVCAKKAGQYTDDKEFIDYLDTQKNTDFYIATDNEATFIMFKEKYPDNIKSIQYHMSQRHPITGSARHTGLRDAIVDMYMCILATNFKGSGWSSFTEVIQAKRDEKATIATV
tara:strand:+ start:42 stop:752 length:711 start_codon:yes stop_codon:yes gene_type:complete